MNFKDQIFLNSSNQIKEDTQVIFVADLFVDDYVGGAELTSDALIQESPFKVQKIKSKDVALSTLKQGMDKFWIFGNFSQLNPELIPSIVANLKYTVLEYDYKFCKYRSPEKHAAETGILCDCHEQINGKVISAFYYGSAALWWMSEKQKEVYHRLFPFLAEKDNIVLSSVFDKTTLAKMSLLSTKSPVNRSRWIVLGSGSWIKGANDAIEWCKNNGKEYDVVWNEPYDKVLERLSSAEGFVYLPKGGDTCPRMVIEAKLLGCKLEINNNVQHKDEDWFTGSVEETREYLYSAPQVFWNGVRTIMEYKPTVSGYTTTYNCISQNYPFEKCIKSMLRFCDEVCVVDGGSTDETWEKLNEWSLKEPRLVIKQVKRDWNHPRFAVFDGMQKAEARKMCSSEFCWQMDSDEIVHEEDAEKVKSLCAKMPPNASIISLPVIEYWGGNNKVRVDIQPWKWRLSRNEPYITHGIPIENRRLDQNGHVYASEGTDGCDMIHAETGQRLPHLTFHSQESEMLRIRAVSGDQNALKSYEQWFNSIIQNLPGVHHYSWYDMTRKIKTYKNYWTKHWLSLYNKAVEDVAENNMFFDLPWSNVSDEMIKQRADEIVNGTGGWVWHKKWDGTRVPHMTIDRKEPEID